MNTQHLAIYNRYLDGYKLADIGRDHGLSRQRVDQIVARTAKELGVERPRRRRITNQRRQSA